MKINTITILLFFLTTIVQAQSENKNDYYNLGINFIAELGLRPGFEVDYGIPLFAKTRAKESKKRSLSHQLHLRPSFAYYRFAHNSNNFLLTAKLNYQFRIVNSSNQRHLSIEPFLRIGYLRKAYIGEIFQTTAQGFEALSGAGTNSFIRGSGLDFGGYLSSKIDWLFGAEYFFESTPDKLNLQRFLVKLGTRIKLNKA